MYIQGELQPVFDALYQMGVIDPVLEMDWREALEQLPDHYKELSQVVQAVNSCGGDVMRIIQNLEKFDSTTLEFLAMEVAREFADFHSRDEVH